ncbi:MAG: IPT/TIG domain-containing protein, partial [Acidimicrobiales bacterium]
PTAVSCPTSSFCVAVDTSGNAFAYDGASWSQPLSIDQGNALTSVSCATDVFCMAVDSAGNALLYDGSSWSATTIDSNGLLSGVSCPQSSFCAAVDTSGYSIFYENGSWAAPYQFAPGDTITSVACASSSVCMAGDKVGDIWTYADGNTQPWPMLPQGYVTSISCSANNYCIAVDSLGGMLYWNGTQWSGPAAVDPKGGGFTSVSCGAANYCAGVDANGYALGATSTATSVQPVLIDPAPLALTFPGSDPYVTSVGGTSMSAIGPPPSETAWNDPQGSRTSGAGSGGVSALSVMPSYQQDSQVAGVLGKYSSAAPCHAPAGSYCREVPDVSASADLAHGYVVDIQGTWQPIGGTSASSPTWASLVALTAETCGKRLGFVNPLLYGIAKADPGAFHDITLGNNDLNDQHGGLYPAASGYDMATGLGSPNASLLAPALCNFQAPPPPPPPPVPALTSISPPSGPASGGTEVTITGENLSGATAVYFGNTAASDVQAVSSSEVTSLSPPGTPGAVAVTVVTPEGTSSSAMSCADTFTYGSSPPSIAPGGYVGMAPTRIADTRAGSGEPYAGDAPPACSTLEVQVAGVGTVPTSIGAAVLNVTAVGPSRPGYLTVYPAGAVRPLASNLNFSPGEVVANLVEVPVSSSGAVDIYNGSGGTTNVVVDVEGYVPAGSSQGDLYSPVTPLRVCDTRQGNPSALSGEAAQCDGRTLSPGTPLQVQIAGLGSVPASASAVVLNLAVVSPRSAGYLTAYPASESPPTASNVNFAAGETIANRSVVALSSSGASSGAIDLISDTTTDVVVDVSGYFSGSGSSYTPLVPARIADTRPGSGEPYAGQTLSPGGVLALQVTGNGGVPAGATAVVLNVTVTGTTAGSYLTAYPAGVSRPTASDLDWSPGETLPNLVVVATGAGGVVDLYNYAGNANVVVDVEGYYG